MRRVERGTCPPHLDGPGSKGYKERNDAIAHYTAVPATTSPFRFRRYKHSSVVQRLEEEYAEKCAYCEAFVAHISPNDIDHFRPKGAYVGPSDVDITPGYYWLASEWSNLFPTCPRCNRRTRQIIVGVGPRMAGKGTHFPLRDESKRAASPGQELREEPLLLNPNQHDVEAHLEFRAGGVVVPATVGASPSERGRVTIDVLGLQRDSLVKRRAVRRHMLEGAVKRYKDELDALGRDSSDANAEYRLTNALREITEYLCHQQEYLSMTRQYIEQSCPELIPLPGCNSTRCLQG